MAWTNWGFDGTINEAQWSQMAGLLGNGYVAADSASCAVTAVGGARSVSVAAGTLYGDGVVSVNSGAETVAMTTPVNGQWYLICLKREWSTNTASLRAVAGATTTTTTPTEAPTSFPTINTSPGVLTDQPIAWAWCNSANTTVVIFDLRFKPYKQTNPVSVSSAADRDARFQSPIQGTTVWRNDLGVTEIWYDLYNISTNPGGRSAAGWYQEKLGRVLQVVNSTTSTSVSTSSATPSDTGLTATITPKSATSKILAIVHQAGCSRYPGSNYTALRLMLLKGSTTLITFTYASGYFEGSVGFHSRTFSTSFLDSPGSTSPQTYKTQFSNYSSGDGTVQVQDGSSMTSTITLMEIAA